MKTGASRKLFLSIQPSGKAISHSPAVHFSIDLSCIWDVTAVSMQLCAAGIGTTKLDRVVMNLKLEVISKHNGNFITLSALSWLYVNCWGYKNCTDASFSLVQVDFTWSACDKHMPQGS